MSLTQEQSALGTIYQTSIKERLEDTRPADVVAEVFAQALRIVDRHFQETIVISAIDSGGDTFFRTIGKEKRGCARYRGILAALYIIAKRILCPTENNRITDVIIRVEA